MRTSGWDIHNSLNLYSCPYKTKNKQKAEAVNPMSYYPFIFTSYLLITCITEAYIIMVQSDMKELCEP